MFEALRLLYVKGMSAQKTTCPIKTDEFYGDLVSGESKVASQWLSHSFFECIQFKTLH
jgi:hypothetical protein